MKLKKLMCLGLALIMALALTAPALASSPTWDTDNEQTSQWTGGTQAPTVKVAVLGSAALVFNPYKLEAKMTAAGVLDSSGNITVKDQIISKPFEIQNQSNVPLRMAVTLGAKAANSSNADDAETATIVKAAPAATITAKQIFVYADFAAFDGTQAQLEKRDEAWLTAQRLTATEATVGDDGWDGTSGGKIEIKNNVGGIYIPAPTTGTPKQNSIWIKLGGAATATPAQTWAATDTLNVYTALKFVPQGTAPLYKIYMANYTAGTDGADPTYAAGVKVDDGDSSTTGAPSLTIPYQNANIDVAIATVSSTSTPLWTTSAKEEQIDGNIEAGYVITINPPKDSSTKKVTHTIKTVNFYDANNTKLTTPKAVTTNSKDKTAPWTFTMPAQNVVIDIVMEAVATS